MEKKRSDIETQQAAMQATEEENRRIAATCKSKCTANAVILNLKRFRPLNH